MQTLYIGTNATGHDSSVFLIIPDSKEVVALSTERVTRLKHDKLFFFPALEKIILNKSIDPLKIETVYLGHSFTSRKDELYDEHEYELLLAERKHFNVRYTKELESARNAFQERSVFGKMFNLLQTKHGRYILLKKVTSKLKLSTRVGVDTIIKSQLRRIFPNAIVHIDYFDHQACHAISSYYSSPFDTALLVSYDGWGDNLFSRAYIARRGDLTVVSSSQCPMIHVSDTEYPYQILGSPGGIYAFFTHLLGFKPVSEEGKVEALAASVLRDDILYHQLMSLFTLDVHAHQLVCNTELAERTISTIQMREFITSLTRETIAATVQSFLNDITEKYIAHLLETTNEKRLCLSGGTTANVIMNLMIFENITTSLHITPAMADDGTAQGAALLSMLLHGYSYENMSWLKGERMPYYGTSYSKKEVLESAATFANRISIKDLGDSWPEEAAALLTQGKIGAIFHSSMEWGPRALGNRSIIADPRPKNFRDKINKTIKRRPLFQPFCPSILAEEAPRLFEHYYLNKHMTCAFRMKQEFWNELPSAIHIDGTARAQFVSKTENEVYYRLIKKVKDITGYGVIINTSFNKHGRTIVESPSDAIVDFLDTDMDYVIIEGILITRI